MITKEALERKYYFLNSEKSRIDSDRVVGSGKSYLCYDKMLEWAMRDVGKRLGRE